MKIQASFVKDGKWWVAWTEDVPGALTQGASLEEARENLVDAVRMMQSPEEINHKKRREHKRDFLCDLCVLCG
jgi:predicted RNase H-like HicB family nuclease